MPIIEKQPGQPPKILFAIRGGENTGDLAPMVRGRLIYGHEAKDKEDSPVLLTACAVFDLPGEPKFSFEHSHRYLNDSNVRKYAYQRAGSNDFLTLVCTTALPVTERGAAAQEDATKSRPFDVADMFFSTNAVLHAMIKILKDTERKVFQSIIFEWLHNNIQYIKINEGTDEEQNVAIMPERSAPSPRSNTLLIEGIVDFSTFDKIARNVIGPDADHKDLGIRVIPNLVEGMPDAYVFDSRRIFKIFDDITNVNIYKTSEAIGKNINEFVNKFRPAITYKKPDMALTVRAAGAMATAAPSVQAAPAVPAVPAIPAAPTAPAVAVESDLARRPRVDPEAAKKEAEKERKRISKEAERELATPEEVAEAEKKKREAKYAAEDSKDARIFVGKVNRAAKRDKPEQFAPFFEMTPTQQKYVINNLDEDSEAALREAYAPCDSGPLTDRLANLLRFSAGKKYFTRRCAPPGARNDPKYDVIDRAAKVIHANVGNALVGFIAVQQLESGGPPLPDDLIEVLGIVTTFGADPEFAEDKEALAEHRKLLQMAWPKITPAVRAAVVNIWKKIQESP